MSAPICPHCQRGVVGPAWVDETGRVLHDGHAEPFRRAQLGLTHECPACGTRGKVTDRDRPERGSREEPDYNAWGSGNGMRSVEYTHYPHTKKCDLCGDEGYLDKPAVPVTVTTQTGWRRT